MKGQKMKFLGRMICFGVLFTAIPILPAGAAATPLTAERSGELAEQLYVNMQAIAAAAEEYHKKEGTMPDAIWMLEDYLKSIPVMSEELGGGDYSVREGYDNMDGRGEWDDAVYSGENIPEEVCLEFNKSYAEPPLNEGVVFDHEAAGGKYPGEVYGRQMKVFAIKWKSDLNVCEIDWVLKYND